MEKRTSRVPGPARRKRRTRAVAPSLCYKDWLIKSLKDPKEAAAYLEAAIEDDDEAGIIRALRNVAQAFGGITRIARAAKLNRETLYRTLVVGGNPELRSLTAIRQRRGHAITSRVSRSIAQCSPRPSPESRAAGRRAVSLHDGIPDGIESNTTTDTPTHQAIAARFILIARYVERMPSAF